MAETLSRADACLALVEPAVLLPHVREWLERHTTTAPGPVSEFSPYRKFRPYRRTQIAELCPWVAGESMSGVSVSPEDTARGSPRSGDMIARNPKNHLDQWLVSRQYFADNFEHPPGGQS